MTYFPNVVHVVQHDEFRHAWWPDRRTSRGYAYNDYRETRNYEFLYLPGDSDQFLDGTIRLVRTIGHTPGHQEMLQLDNRGTVGLMGDAAHLQEAVDADPDHFAKLPQRLLGLSYRRNHAAGPPLSAFSIRSTDVSDTFAGNASGANQPTSRFSSSATRATPPTYFARKHTSRYWV